jgi:arabinose-5-phosphate isomerase
VDVKTRRTSNESKAIARARLVLEAEACAIRGLIDRLDGSFEDAVRMLAECRGRVVTSGIGKSGIICQKIASTLSSTGTPALFMHPAEAIHGDIGMLAPGDVMIVLSNSGETEELVRLLPLVRRLGVSLLAMVGHPGSSLARDSDVVLDVSIREEACPLGLAPTASTTAALAMGDALAMALVERRGFSAEEFAERHPGGNLGRRFLRVCDLMHTGDRLPRVPIDAPIEQVELEMTSKGFGVTSVIDGEGRLAGIITDGDMRRLLGRRRDRAFQARAADAMTSSPRTADGKPQTIDRDALAASALELMERFRITSLLVLDEGGRPEGIIHLHDLWRTQLF